MAASVAGGPAARILRLTRFRHALAGAAVGAGRRTAFIEASGTADERRAARPALQEAAAPVARGSAVVAERRAVGRITRDDRPTVGPNTRGQTALAESSRAAHLGPGARSALQKPTAPVRGGTAVLSECRTGVGGA